MTKTEMKIAVDHHVCALKGDAHRLRLQWVATEPRFSKGGRYLLAIDLFDDGSERAMTTVHVMTGPQVTRRQLLDLVDDAVNEQMQHLRLETASTADEPSREVMA